MQPDDIIKQFEVYVDDLTELSTDEEYALLTKVLNSIYNDRSWEFLRKTANVTTTTTKTAPLPVDFVSVMNNYSENPYNNIPEIPVVFVDGIPYKFVPKGMSYNFVGGNYATVNLADKTIEFLKDIGTGKTVTFDYKYQPTAIVSNSSTIVLPELAHRYLGQVMAIDDDIIQKTEKARSNLQSNSVARAQMLRDLAHYNARFLNY